MCGDANTLMPFFSYFFIIRRQCQLTEIVVKSAVAKFLKKKGLRCSVGLYAALDTITFDALEKAVERAKKNKRSTVMKQDL
ncbi:hypothetical protein AUJ65_03385 [Candidatus Micrarchaeota archaeon CG1_02_51_15]|nr:MAG: hypothetical protein AUJ65_03385 [Candidatus Micrarchaeota archaeon CG1_02_51_15]